MRHTALGGQDSTNDRPEPHDSTPGLHDFPVGSRWRNKRSGRTGEIVASGWDSSSEDAWFCLEYRDGALHRHRRMTLRSLLRCYSREDSGCPRRASRSRLRRA